MTKRSKKASKFPSEGPWLKDDLVVWRVRKNQNCAMCKRPLKKQRQDLASMEQSSNRWFATCLQCLHVDHLAFLPAGDSRVTRMASRLSSRRAVVMSTKYRHQRREGILVEIGALREACEKYDIEIPFEYQENLPEDPSEDNPKSTLLTTPQPPRPTPTRTVRRESTRNYRFYGAPTPRAAQKPQNDTIQHPTTKPAARHTPKPAQKPAKSANQDYIQTLSQRIRARYPRSPDQMVNDITHYAMHVYLPENFPNDPLPPANDVDLGPLLTAFLRR